MNKTLTELITVIKLLLQKRRLRYVFEVTALLYMIFYLMAIGDLGFHGWQNEVAFRLGSQPLDLMFKQISPFYFEAVAMIKLPLITYLFSPINVMIGILLALLVGLNVALSYIAMTQPKVCYGNSAMGLLSALPALIAGSACCAPVILIVIGVQASASLIAFFGMLIPLALFLLMGTLVLNSKRTNIDYLQQVS